MYRDVVVCAFGKVGLGSINQLLSMSKFPPSDIFVYTHNRESNKELIDYLACTNIAYSFENISDCYVEVKAMRPKYIISMFYRYIIDDRILKIVNYNTLNVHQSLLPLYKGRFIAFWNVFNNDKYAGITYHRMIKEVDAGEVFLVKKIKLNKSETAYSLHNKLIYLAVSGFQIAFNRLINDYTLKDFDYLTSGTSYFKNTIPFNGILDAEKTSYDKAICFVKAMYFPPLPGGKFKIKDSVVEINNLECLEKYRKHFKSGKGSYG